MKTNKLLFVIFLLASIFAFSFNTSVSQVTDKDNNTYKTVVIGTQEWMAENLNVEHYRNGDVIPQVQDAAEWKKLTTGAWCYYEHNSENGITYGKLYNWYAVTDPRGLAPEGWHVPSNDEWNIIEDFLGGGDKAGGKMKSTTLWEDPNTGATNESGFTGLPGGYNGDGKFQSIGKKGYFWTSTKITTIASRYKVLNKSETKLIDGTSVKSFGYSVRCIKD